MKFKIINKAILMMIAILVLSCTVMAVGMNVETLPVHWVGHDAAVLKGNLTDLGLEDNVTVYFNYTETDNIDWVVSTQTEVMNETGEFSLNIFDLDGNTNYTYVAYVTNNVDATIGALNNETFLTSTAPTTTLTTSSTEETNLTMTVSVTDLGNATEFNYTITCYDDEGTSYNSSTQTINTTGAITASVTGLTEETTYYCTPLLEWTYDGDNLISQPFTSTLTTDSSTEDVENGITGIQTTTFVAFGLIAVMLLAAIAMAFIAMMNNGASIGTLMTLAILAIGVAIVLFVGFIIMSLTANSIVLAI